jgi:hypothetical protein
MGLWEGSEHKEITSEAFGSLFSGAGTRDWVLKTLIDNNAAVDGWFAIGQVFGGVGFYQQEWHYLSPGETYKEAYKTKYSATLDQTRKEIERLVGEAQRIRDDRQRGSPCQGALEKIGNRDHAMQDFYAHATLRPPPGKTAEMPEVNSEAAFGVMSSFAGWVAWSIGITATPEKPDGTWPGTFFIIAHRLGERSEHPWTSEPVGSGCEIEKRRDAAVRFQKQVYSRSEDKSSLIYWGKMEVCGCWAELEHGK